MAQKPQGTGPATDADHERQQQQQQENRENEANRATKDRQQQGSDGHMTSPGGQQSR
jgi:hypothetical protein